LTSMRSSRNFFRPTSPSRIPQRSATRRGGSRGCRSGTVAFG
jgi:hypothetical protein